MSRIGAARIFFDVVGIFQAEKFLTDTKSSFLAWKNITNAIMIDTLTAVNEAVELFAEQFDGMIQATVPLAVRFAEARIEFKKFAQAIEDADIEDMGSKVRKIGEQYAFTADKSYEAAGRLSQLSGVLRSQAAILAATEGAIQFGFIGGMETETAAKRLIQLQAQTHFMFGNLTQAQYDHLTASEQAALVTENLGKTMSALNTIENRSAATMSQLTFVMNQFASSAVLAGDSVEEMAAMAAVLIESGEEQGKAGRALRIMYARLGANMSHNNEILEHWIGAIRDSQGQMLSMTQIIGRLHPKWQQMNQDQKMQVSQAIAGNDHYVRFIKLMEGYERSVTLTSQAMQGLDNVYDEMALFTSDPAFQLQQLNAELDNTNELIGQELLPVSIAMAEAEVAMAQGVEILASAFSGLFGDRSNLFVMIEMAKKMYDMAQASFDMYLNLRNMNVALQSQYLIMRAIQGDKFIEVQNNKNILMSSEMTLAILKARNHEEAQYAMQQFHTAAAQKHFVELKKQEVELSKYTLEVEKDRKEIIQHLGMFSALRVQDLLYEGELVGGLSLMEKSALDIQKQSVVAGNQRVAAAEALGALSVHIADVTLVGLMNEAALTQDILENEAAIERHKLLGTLIDEDMIEGARARAHHASRTLGMEHETTKELYAQFAAMVAQRDLGATLLSMDEAEVEVHQQKLNQLTKIIQAELMRRAGENQTVYSRGELAWITSELERAEREEALAAQAAAEAGDAAAGAADREAAAKERLNIILLDMKLARDGNLATAKQENYNSYIAADANAKWKKSLEDFNRSAVAASLGASAAALSFQLLGKYMGLDKKESAAAGMVAMTLAMIPAQAQMIMMTVQMMMLGDETLEAGFALKKLGKIAGVVFIAVGVISYFVAKAASAKKEIADLAAEVDSFNESLLDFYNIVDQETFSAMVVEDSRTVRQLTEDIEEQNNVIRQKMDLAEAADTITRGLINTEIEGLEAILAADKGLLLYRQANQFGGKSVEDIQFMISQMKLLEEGTYDYMRAEVLMEGNTDRYRFYDNMGFAAGHKAAFATQEQADAWVAAGDALRQWEQDNRFFIEWWNTVGANSYSTYNELTAKGLSLWVDEGPAASDAITDLTTTWDDATESLDNFSSAAEEFFYGGSLTMATGDLLKQIVSKGAENLIQNTELLMTNNFYGLTLPQMVDAVADGVTEELYNRGVVT